MKRRRLQLRITGLVAGLALAVPLMLGPTASQAGFFRDTLVSLGLAKPAPPAPGTPGSKLPRQGFACCNLHYEKDWINDGNYAELPMIAAGTPIEVISYGRHRAYVKVDGKPMRLGHDYGRDQETLEQWVDKIVVSEDPRPRIESYPQNVREAIQAGKLLIGMTREQAIVSIGYPLTDENGPLDGPLWKMWRSTHGEYDLNFRPDGHLESVSGEEAVTSLMVFKPSSP
jgi:hypothetical protein